MKEVLEISWKNLWSFFWVSILVGLAVMGGFILIVIPGFIFAVWFYFSVYVFVFEGLKGTSALKRSKQLVNGYFWPIFGRVLLLSLAVGIVGAIPSFGPIISTFFSAPFAVVYMYTLYDNVKRIKG